MKRIRLNFANTQIDFIDRELALKRIEEWANKGTYPVQVVYGPEGCGKTAWLKQSTELLKELGFHVIYINPVEREFTIETGVEDVRRRFLEILHEATNESWIRAVWAAIDLTREIIRLSRGKIAVIVDDAFQAIGLDKAAIYVKGLLGLIEYPPEPYERIITIAATSEGVSLREIGRHRWAESTPMWNMAKEGFEQLYNQIPGSKPDFDAIWRVTGGNPAMLERLYRAGWDVDRVIKDLIREKNVTPSFIRRWSNHLREAINDPDHLWEPDTPEELIDELIERNLIMYFLPDRDPELWIDKPPPERDPELGIGKYVTWQSPIHREAVKRALEWVR